jgi:hypothetical protein
MYVDLRVFKNRVLGKIFGPKMDEVSERAWRKIRNEELSDMLSSYCDQINKNEMGWVCRTYWREERVLLGKPEGRRQLGRPRRRWEYNIKMDLQEV